MAVGQRSLFFIFLFLSLCASCQTSSFAFYTLPPVEEIKPIAEVISSHEWEKVKKRTQEKSHPLFQLIHLLSLYELKQFNNVLTAPSLHPLFKPYENYLKILAALESKNWDKLLEIPFPESLPTSFKEKLIVFYGDAHFQKNEFEKAKGYYLKVDAEPGVLLKLAEVERKLGHQMEALKIYEHLYKLHPLSEDDQHIREELQHSGALSHIPTDAHLARIQKLKQSAQFKQAEKELQQLKKILKNEKERVNLAWAELHLAQREYRQAEKLARQVLKKSLKEKDHITWRLILAIALARQQKLEESQNEYTSLLLFSLAPSLREMILLRLGLIAVDHLNFDRAAKRFEELRQRFPKGQYLESAHWFEAWSLYQTQLQALTPNRKKILKAIHLLEKLSQLPEGTHLEPQALYWSLQMAKLIQDKKREGKFQRVIKEKWSTSFYALLLEEKPFSFLANHRPSVISTSTNLPQRTSRELQKFPSWQRLESFTALKLQDWARIELHEFLKELKNTSTFLKLTIARHFEAQENWSALLSWSWQSFENSLENFKPTKEQWFYFYPQGYSDAVLKFAKESRLSPFIIWGVMREESRFDPEARSRAGALGLMQLMPPLAYRMGRILNDPPHLRLQVQEPRRNIRYGSHHLKELFKTADYLKVPKNLKPILAIAAYNAGFPAVEKWLKEKDTSRIDHFVESIPFSETRSYVKRVLQSAWIYSQLYETKDLATQKEDKL